MSKGSGEESKKLLTDNIIITNIGFQIYMWFLMNLTIFFSTT